ncbi:head closure Hc1 [Mycobacterium phage Turbido]|uniref:Head-to-tail stopper n=8 Tax=Turbidovirus TaxID=2948936 RepID=A0A1D8EZQ9_9CAUD|nr:head closure Hc1 [Mycobacterium phage Turbido]YP_010063553.1 head closure Hc1 [Mycobacterium phage Bugsy]AOT27707.1 head-to-tail stopper [Mycobacterium phage Jerm]AWH13539.1 head-to-tail stopper [Mycobacterium phage AbbyPaige]AYD86571.1 head-to-tail stopper [Mycobacterium phage LilTurb]QBI96525.1 head-to-tail stopper [Mycobacterium phage Whabigail7]QUE25696.1 head-to-tail stopper [Mycobacterium phage Smeagan]QWS69751.1 head-to-tail stopper [Mycobacterium Phage Leviathan]QZE10921.1 head-t
MSLLDTGARYQPVTVYPEEMVIDGDGNKRTRPSKTGIPAIARLQVANQSGTSARRAEQDNEGFESEKVYRMRFPRSFTKEHGILGMQSQIEWRGQRWALFGDATVYDSSPALARVDYTIKRY